LRPHGLRFSASAEGAAPLHGVSAVPLQPHVDPREFVAGGLLGALDVPEETRVVRSGSVFAPQVSAHSLLRPKIVNEVAAQLLGGASVELGPLAQVGLLTLCAGGATRAKADFADDDRGGPQPEEQEGGGEEEVVGEVQGTAPEAAASASVIGRPRRT